jgi:hypothetical protein
MADQAASQGAQHRRVRIHEHREAARGAPGARPNTIAVCAGDLVRPREPARLTTTPKLLLAALVERLEAPATGGRETKVE